MLSSLDSQIPRVPIFVKATLLPWKSVIVTDGLIQSYSPSDGRREASQICAVALYLLLDQFLDPIFEGMLPGSEERYQETLQSLREAPVISFVHVCILAPFLEESLMRGFLLGGLSLQYGSKPALLLSAAVFALLHFNMVQTLSALLCDILLGLLYLQTGSLLCCITAHAGYNMISYFTAILPERKKP